MKYEEQVPRYEELKNEIIKRGFIYSHCVRAPGRVNLLGEHIDYNGYQVAPIALE